MLKRLRKKRGEKLLSHKCITCYKFSESIFQIVFIEYLKRSNIREKKFFREDEFARINSRKKR